MPFFQDSHHETFQLSISCRSVVNLLAFVPIHFLYNREAKFKCPENPSYMVSVTGDHFMGDTTVCVHKPFVGK